MPRGSHQAANVASTATVAPAGPLHFARRRRNTRAPATRHSTARTLRLQARAGALDTPKLRQTPLVQQQARPQELVAPCSCAAAGGGLQTPETLGGLGASATSRTDSTLLTTAAPLADAPLLLLALRCIACQCACWCACAAALRPARALLGLCCRPHHASHEAARAGGGR